MAFTSYHVIPAPVYHICALLTGVTAPNKTLKAKHWARPCKSDTYTPVCGSGSRLMSLILFVLKLFLLHLSDLLLTSDLLKGISDAYTHAWFLFCFNSWQL